MLLTKSYSREFLQLHVFVENRRNECLVREPFACRDCFDVIKITFSDTDGDDFVFCKCVMRSCLKPSYFFLHVWDFLIFTTLKSIFDCLFFFG